MKWIDNLIRKTNVYKATRKAYEFYYRSYQNSVKEIERLEQIINKGVQQ